ncbi:MAG: amidase domain-containing protein [Ruminiclostridium sp.]|nr:amidase domain-containing protein [Ruminiclostridium sp.]
MLETYSLDTGKMIDYAAKWAYSYNPDFYDFTELGGDCTNFISQCVYAGGAVMNYTPDTGWYYIALSERAAAWTGVEFFARFVLNNRGAGPFGSLVRLRELRAGDVVQLGDRSGFYHSLLVTDILYGIPYVTAHTYNVYNKPLAAYSYENIRCIRLNGARRYV